MTHSMQNVRSGLCLGVALAVSSLAVSPVWAAAKGPDARKTERPAVEDPQNRLCFERDIEEAESGPDPVIHVPLVRLHQQENPGFHAKGTDIRGKPRIAP